MCQHYFPLINSDSALSANDIDYPMITEDAEFPLHPAMAWVMQKPPFPKIWNEPDPAPNCFGIQLSGFVIFKVFLLYIMITFLSIDKKTTSAILSIWSKTKQTLVRSQKTQNYP